MKRIIIRLLNTLDYRIIQGECAKEKGPLLIRYYLANNRFFAVYIHHLMRSDDERHLHDHPWSFVSLILRGSYREHTPAGVKQYNAGSVLFRPAEWSHALELKKPAWSLVIAGPTRRAWGFHTEQGWVFWRDYDKAERERCS